MATPSDIHTNVFLCLLDKYLKSEQVKEGGWSGRAVGLATSKNTNKKMKHRSRKRVQCPSSEDR